jgi:hypothetical protein
VDKGENRPMTEREAGTEIIIRLPKQSLELAELVAHGQKNIKIGF